MHGLEHITAEEFSRTHDAVHWGILKHRKLSVSPSTPTRSRRSGGKFGGVVDVRLELHGVVDLSDLLR
jgi:hypothetical protein